MASLVIELCNELSKHVEALTTSGKKELDEGIMKKVKKICKISNEYVKQLYHLAMTQLNKDHAEIRYGAVLLINEIFLRSHVFREMLLAEFQDFLELSVETDSDMPLPPPKAAAKDLKIKALQIIQEWNTKFGEDYKRLNLGFKYLKHCKKVDFDDARSRSIIQRQREEEEQRRKDQVIAEKVNKTKQEMLDRSEEISSVLTQVENCFRILLPHPDEFFTEHDFMQPSTSGVVSDSKNNSESTASNSKKLDNVEDSPPEEISASTSAGVPETLRQHGLHDRKFNLTIEINKESASVVEENEDTSPVIENLRDLHSQIVSEYLPLILKWTKVFTSGSNCTDSLKKAIDLKQMLESSISKFKELKIMPKPKCKDTNHNDGEDDSEDEELVEVEEKEGYEPVIPVHKRKEYGLDISPQKISATNEMKKLEEIEKRRLWDLRSQEESANDPTSRLSTLNVLCNKYKDILTSTKTASTSPESSNLENSKGKSKKESSESSRKEKLLSAAPVLPFDIDLYHWEDEKLEAPVIHQFSGLHCFWQLKNDDDLNEAHAEEGAAALRRRYIDFSGEFVPVKWSCRAPLPSGKLCPRKDRYKCPLHGPIIARDEMGNPVNPENGEVKTLLDQPSTSKETIPDWQDPELLRDIEAATGVNLKMPEKRKSKGKLTKGKSAKKPKYPGLTDIKKVENTARKRLEKKVLNKNSVKKVSATLDSLDRKRFFDKYGNQWNYAFQT